MIIQPRGIKRKSTSAALMIEIRKEIEYLAAKYNCSKSFVVATLLAEQLNIKEQVKFYDYNPTNQKRTNVKGSRSQASRNKR